MIFNFQQGIASYPISNNIQQFLSKSGTYVTLTISPGSLVRVSFADGSVDYLWDESIGVPNAWGPIAAATPTWIYWDIHTLTGARTFGQTTLEPVYGPTAPASPLIDQHWFDTTRTTMFVHNGYKWVRKIRVFAARVLDNTFTALGHDLLNAPFAGSQVNMYGPSYQIESSYILYDTYGKPIPTQPSGSFLRVNDEFLIQGSHVTHVNLESYVLRLMADEPIARYTVGKVVGEHHVVQASYHDLQDGVIAIAADDLSLYETGAFVAQGVITNLGWNWGTSPGTPLWINGVGELVDVDPHVSDVLTYPNAKPPIGRVLSSNSIIFNQGMGGKGERGLPGDGGGGTTAPATTLTPGIVRLSTTPADSEDPIVVSVTDPRLTDARTPTSHTHGSADITDLAALLSAKVDVAGDTMTGPLTLSGDPTNNLHAATKQYVDAAAGNSTAQSSIPVTQNGHSFVVGNAVYHNGTVWAKARADSPDTLAIAMVVEVVDANNVVLQQSGTVEGLTGLSAGQYYFTSAVTAGTLTSVEPVQYSNPMLLATSATTGIILPYRPSASVSGSDLNAGETVFYKSNEDVVELAIGTPVYAFSATGLKRASALNSDAAEVIGLVSTHTLQPGTASVTAEGILTLTATEAEFITGDIGGLMTGFTYFLSTTPGKLTTVAPSADGQYVCSVGKAVSPQQLYVNIGYKIQI